MQTLRIYNKNLHFNNQSVLFYFMLILHTCIPVPDIQHLFIVALLFPFFPVYLNSENDSNPHETTMTLNHISNKKVLSSKCDLQGGAGVPLTLKRTAEVMQQQQDNSLCLTHVCSCSFLFDPPSWTLNSNKSRTRPEFVSRLSHMEPTIISYRKRKVYLCILVRSSGLMIHFLTEKRKKTNDLLIAFY